MGRLARGVMTQRQRGGVSPGQSPQRTTLQEEAEVPPQVRTEGGEQPSGGSCKTLRLGGPTLPPHRTGPQNRVPG